MKIAVTGPKGRLASWLIEHHGCEPFDVDITNLVQVRMEVDRLRPDVIIHTAAYTNVDEAEKEKELAIVTNMRGTGNIRLAFDGYAIYISTSYVFDGQKHGAYTEKDSPNPLGQYAWTKWGGEASFIPLTKQSLSLIVRTVSLYGPGPKEDFVSNLVRRLEAKEEIALPADLYSTPTYIPHLAEGIMECVEGRMFGILNIVGRNSVNRYSWGQAVADVFELDKELLYYGSYRGTVMRPKNASLNTMKARMRGVPIFSLNEGLVGLKKWRTQSNLP